MRAMRASSCRRCLRTLGWVAGLGLLVVALSPAASAGWRRSARELAQLLQREATLTQTAADVHRGLSELDRERASLEYTLAVLDHAGRESMRRLDAYRRVRGVRERNARARARALYKLSRGRLARLAFEDLSSGKSRSSARVQQGRALRFLVRHDLRELAVRERAEARARSELVAAARELQALSALTMVQSMQEHALVTTEVALDPELSRAHRRRRRVLEDGDERALRANRKLLRLVHRNWNELRSLRGLDAAGELLLPVPGFTVGDFGPYEDRVLRLPMVRNGVELRARKNETVRAMADGRVVMVTELPGYEQVVVVDHGGGQYTLTARLWQIVVEEGEEIKAGDALGAVAPKTVDDGLGRTVYLELRHGEKPIDPGPYLRRARRRAQGSAQDSKLPEQPDAASPAGEP